MKEWYQDATSVPNGQLFFYLTPKTVGSLRYCSNSGSVKKKLPAGTETKFLDDEYKKPLCSPNISTFFPETSKTIHSYMSKIINSISERVVEKPIQKRNTEPSRKRRSEILKNISEFTQKRTPLNKRRII